MNNSIQVFSNQDFSVRTVREADGTVWFVAKDVMTALEYAESSTPAQIMQSVPDIWKGIKRIDSRSENGVEQSREMLCLTEQGVYFFLGRSDKPKALPYQMWVAGEIMPSIRETGSYSTQKEQSAMSAGLMEGAKVVFEAAKIGDKWEPLQPGATYAIMQDVGKMRSNGTPVRQLKWDSGILEVFGELLSSDN